ncbi:DNA polymerase III subunit epsilon [Thioalkalivibrio denitrificans]|uniref:DNA polymerase III subunit epsilon n=1 Tax=Thioalkalivibrio denitrificans TaxID=108003 RepID=A0A1V3NS50_9GAMM|nr:3'-5' exonuclease [Thioalkalivibrio denitrificans]OOG27844.1 DNA polymerase III subunit epsilon [Thioalkalivibrio denitrificans]
MAGEADNSGEKLSWHEFFARQAQACTTPALRRFYEAGLPTEDTPIADVPLLALDFETTGLDARTDAIVSIGAVPFDLKSIRPAHGRYWVVRPSRPLSEESIAFHRITHSEVQNAPLLEAVLDELLDTLAGRVIVVHFLNIERPFLDAAARTLRGESCLFPVIDTMELEARHERQGRFQRIKKFFGVKPASIRLADSRARYGLPAYSPHHAKVDAMATAELFLAQVARHYSPQTPLSAFWL